MFLKPVNIEEKLKHQQDKFNIEKSIINQVKSILQEHSKNSSRITNNLNNSKGSANNLDLNLLDTDKIYHISSIKTTCINYRLRFLESKYFKNTFPDEAISKIKALEKRHNTELTNFKVMAPSKLFRLQNPDDPVLFASIGNDYYYLIHKWGNDLHPLRKWLMLPFKNLENLMITAFILSFALTSVLNINTITSPDFNPTNFWILFLFMLKSVIGVIIYYSFSQGKNFNTAIWNSKYSKT